MMKTQNDRLLAYLKEHGSIDPFEAWSMLGIYRLGARIFDLRQEGHDIERELKKVKNQFDETCRVARYRLAAAPQVPSKGPGRRVAGRTGAWPASGMATRSIGSLALARLDNRRTSDGKH